MHTKFGGGLKMREKDIEKILVAGVKELGGRAYKWVSPGNDGVPDRIVILPGMRPVFVELKTETGKLSALQGMQVNRLRELEQEVEVLHGLPRVRDFLEECERRIGARAYWERGQSRENDDD